MFSSCYDFCKSAVAPVLKTSKILGIFFQKSNLQSYNLVGGEYIKIEYVALNAQNVVINKANNKLSNTFKP